MSKSDSESKEMQDEIRILLALYEEYRDKSEKEEYESLDRDTIRKMADVDLCGLARQWGINEDRVLDAVESLVDRGLVEKLSRRLANLTQHGVEFVEHNLLV